eukprot:CAMPEP_0194372716 /NCGR_PEP_ID=MMETSP0174-20130528/21104_1 /TAXON_ID=216777 /ORGANISM="Proboscia alata, Strain PI-D3" /LENGTH=417 /DNA_ID=CAMNT_0039151397 /DNA_START=12 /DNA_END=1261 /DNA_ORIENTATION=-
MALGPKQKRPRNERRDKNHKDIDRLIQTTLTNLRRHGKTAKTSAIQSAVKKLKMQHEVVEKLLQQQQTTLPNNDDADDTNDLISAKENGKEEPINDSLNSKTKKNLRKAQNRLVNLERKLDLIKSFDLSVLLVVCLKRLGFAQLGVDIDNIAASHSEKHPKKEHGKHCATKSEDDAETINELSDSGTVTESAVKIPDAATMELVESLLLNKKLSSAMDDSDTKVTEYRQRLMRASSYSVEEDALPSKKKRKLLAAAGNQQQESSEYIGNSGIFIDSLSGVPSQPSDQQDIEGTTYDQYVPDGEDEYAAISKQPKNRMGQRARKIKAMAQQARKEGRKWDGNASWREKKNDDNQQEVKKEKKASGLAMKQSVDASSVANMGTTWKEEGKAHPSWAAKEQAKMKSGIAKFEGKAHPSWA